MWLNKGAEELHGRLMVQKINLHSCHDIIKWPLLRTLWSPRLWYLMFFKATTIWTLVLHFIWLISVRWGWADWSNNNTNLESGCLKSCKSVCLKIQNSSLVLSSLLVSMPWMTEKPQKQIILTLSDCINIKGTGSILYFQNVALFWK